MNEDDNKTNEEKVIDFNSLFPIEGTTFYDGKLDFVNRKMFARIPSGAAFNLYGDTNGISKFPDMYEYWNYEQNKWDYYLTNEQKQNKENLKLKSNCSKAFSTMFGGSQTIPRKWKKRVKHMFEYKKQTSPSSSPKYFIKTVNEQNEIIIFKNESDFKKSSYKKADGICGKKWLVYKDYILAQKLQTQTFIETNCPTIYCNCPLVHLLYAQPVNWPNSLENNNKISFWSDSDCKTCQVFGIDFTNPKTAIGENFKKYKVRCLVPGAWCGGITDGDFSSRSRINSPGDLYFLWNTKYVYVEGPITDADFSNNLNRNRINNINEIGQYDNDINLSDSLTNIRFSKKITNNIKNFNLKNELTSLDIYFEKNEKEIINYNKIDQIKQLLYFEILTRISDINSYQSNWKKELENLSTFNIYDNLNFLSSKIPKEKQIINFEKDFKQILDILKKIYECWDNCENSKVFNFVNVTYKPLYKTDISNSNEFTENSISTYNKISETAFNNFLFSGKYLDCCRNKKCNKILEKNKELEKQNSLSGLSKYEFSSLNRCWLKMKETTISQFLRYSTNESLKNFKEGLNWELEKNLTSWYLEIENSQSDKNNCLPNLNTEELSTLNTFLSCDEQGNYTNFKETDKNTIIKFNDLKNLYMLVKKLILDCICYADCNNFQICRCYGNCGCYHTFAFIDHKIGDQCHGEQNPNGESLLQKKDLWKEGGLNGFSHAYRGEKNQELEIIQHHYLPN